MSDLNTFTARSSGRELTKRDLTLIDMSDEAITLTLWGADAQQFNVLNNPVIMLRSARISEFNGRKTLSLAAGSSMVVNPNNSDGIKLREWFDNGGAGALVNQSARSGTGSPAYAWTTLFDASVQENHSKSFKLTANILSITKNNAVYRACPRPIMCITFIY